PDVVEHDEQDVRCARRGPGLGWPPRLGLPVVAPDAALELARLHVPLLGVRPPAPAGRRRPPRAYVGARPRRAGPGRGPAVGGGGARRRRRSGPGRRPPRGRGTARCSPPPPPPGRPRGRGRRRACRWGRARSTTPPAWSP